ncbi:MAG: exodeoxyribonuclease III [Lautropia sp.]|nr:exodeoxyribonuclease III [Lautropia sp.]
MKIATWNVNSLKMRLQHLLDWLAANPVDFLCLQETKLTDDKFPRAEIEAAGYGVVFTGQPTYNGVALLYRQEAGYVPEGIHLCNPLKADDPQKRLVSARFRTAAGLVRIIGAYFPNGQALDSEKFPYKLGWIEALRLWMKQLQQDEPDTALVLAGDFNIAPTDADVHDPAAWEGKVHVSPQERQALQTLLDLGLHDAFRLFEQEPKLYSWWDYRMLGFRRNAGLRIDLILISDSLRPGIDACWIDKAPRKLEKPSDHTPVVLRWEKPA